MKMDLLMDNNAMNATSVRLLDPPGAKEMMM
jgi:hypothetical protein